MKSLSKKKKMKSLSSVMLVAEEMVLMMAVEGTVYVDIDLLDLQRVIFSGSIECTSVIYSSELISK